MAITFLQEKKRQQYLFIAFVIIVLTTGAIILPRIFFPEEVASPVVSIPPQPRKIEINFDIFSHPIFEQLDAPRPTPLIPEQFGRPNPFLPF